MRQGKALYVGISSYDAEQTREAAAILRDLGTPLPDPPADATRMLNRWIEDGLLDVLGEEGIGCIVFSPLAQGLLTDRYLDGIPRGLARVDQPDFPHDRLTDDAPRRLRKLNEIAAARGQSLAQMALAWVLRDPRVTSTLVGASVEQLEENVAALDRLELSADELAAIEATLAGL